MKNFSSTAGIVLSFLFLGFFSPLNSWSQAHGSAGRIAQKIAELKRQNLFANQTALFSLVKTGGSDVALLSKSLKQFTLLDVSVSNILQAKPDFINCLVPIDNGTKSLRVLLYKEVISPNGFVLLSSDGKTYPAVNIVHYRGSIDGDPNSVAALSFSQNEVAGFINNAKGNYVIGKLEGNSAKHIIYNDKDVLEKVVFDCGTNTAIPMSAGTYLKNTESTQSLTAKCVNWYWETDYDLFVIKGSVANVNSFMQGVFNQVATLYANDGVSITLRTLYVWSTDDPYTGTSTSGYLDQFGAYRTTFDGDLATLIGTKGGGGIAWINGLCNSQNKYKMAYCGISTSYSTVPTYSWTVECITHEQGHLLGSRHTHDCAWNGNNTKIDGCGDNAGYVSGTCANPGNPAGGGTIMSYCHLTNVGINFNLGFGPQPTTLIVNNVNNASCLSTCSSTCTVPAQAGAIAGNSSVCSGTAQTYSVTAVSGATSYSWSLPSGWSGSSTTNSITLTAGTASGNISVTAINTCGAGTAQSKAITSQSAAVQPGTITGNSSACPGTSQTYSVAAVPGATSYTWTIPSGWSGTSTTNTISSTAGSAGGSVTVKANNACGSSATRTLTVSITASAPAQPGTISGAATVCPGAVVIYSVAAVAGATTYNWTLPSGWSGSSTTNSISVTAGTVTGNISVTSSNGCGTSVSRSLSVSASGSVPSKPGVIAITGGTARVCNGDTRTYSVAAVAGISYTWTPPTGGTIISGQGTASISITYNAGFTASSQLTVSANNSCGTSPLRKLNIIKNTPPAPGSISGSSTVCPGSAVTYTAAPIAAATSYIWGVPAGASIQGASNGNSITILWGSTGGNLTVRASNACGNSGLRSLKITINCSGGRIASKSQPQYPAGIDVYPNPASGIANVRFFSELSGNYELKIMDLAGRLLTTQKVQAINGMNISKLDVSKFTSGVYLISIEGGNTKQILKINIQ